MQRFEDSQLETRVHHEAIARIKRYSFPALILIVSLSSGIGCVSDSYRFGTATSTGYLQPRLAETFNPILEGGAHPRLDRIESAVQAPRRLIQKIKGQPQPKPAEIAQRRAQSTELAREYLAANGLHDISIDVRAYEPVTQWRRLKTNTHVRPFWKYTGGTLNWLRYTLLPMRAFQTDRYDPYTNTLNLNSTRQSTALYESAVAKEYRSHHRLGVGTYAALQYVPLIPLYHNAKAGSDLLTYCEHQLDGKLADQLYPLTYSRIGSAAVSEALSIVTLAPNINEPLLTSPLLRIAGSTAGHSTGTLYLQSRKDDNPKKTESPDVQISNIASFGDEADDQKKESTK